MNGIIRGLWRQKQVSHTGISNCTPQNSVGCNYLSLPEMPASVAKVLIGSVTNHNKTRQIVRRVHNSWDVLYVGGKCSVEFRRCHLEWHCMANSLTLPFIVRMSHIIRYESFSVNSTYVQIKITVHYNASHKTPETNGNWQAYIMQSGMSYPIMKQI